MRNLKTLLCLILIGALSACKKEVVVENKNKEKQPNIIYVLVDQLRYDALGYAGDSKAQTPHLDKLASQSMNFTNTVSVTPVCSAHRASLLTGKYTSSTGVVVNELRLNPNQRALGYILTENGYETCYIGKWHLYSNCSDHHAVECAYIPPGKHRLGFNGVWKSFNFHHENYNSYYFEDEPVKLQYKKPYEPEAQFDMALDYLDSASKKSNPFAMVLSIGLPHDPWSSDNVPAKNLEKFNTVAFDLPPTWSDTPDKYMDRNTDLESWLSYWKPNIPNFKKVYYAMVNSVDEQMGRLIKKLDDLKLTDNTILVFSSDHGEMFGENGRVFKLTFYEGAARVPFLVRWPKKITPGTTDALLNTPDVMPTLLTLCGLTDKTPDTVEGMDLSHLCLGQSGKEPEAAFMQGMGHTFQWKDGHEWRAVRNKRFTYARYLIDGKELLFDNQNDPLQTKNIINDDNYIGTANELRQFMAKKMKVLNDEFKACTWYKDHWVDKDRNIIKSAKGVF